MTPFNIVYRKFEDKVTDYDFINLAIDDLEDIEHGYLTSAIVKFKNCRQSLSNRDETLKQFNFDLTDEEIEILAILMIVEWLSPLIYTTELMKQQLSTKDFNRFSQAQHLKEVKELKKDAIREASQLKTVYGYSNGLEDLK